MIKKKLLFFGELPPKTIHGASISNSINLEQLSDIFQIYVVEEFSDLLYLNNFAFEKLYSFFHRMVLLLKVSIKYKFQYFYGVIYLSTFGIVKNLISVSIYKIFNPFGKVILHFHRSDFDEFYKSYTNRYLFILLDILVDKFIVLSQIQKQKLVNLKQSKLYILYNTIEEEFDLGELKSEDNPKLGQIRVVYIGNYILEKGVIELIEAIIKLNKKYELKFRLELYGNYTSSSIINKLQDLVLFDSNISLNGPISGLDKFNKIYNSDLVALPSYNEGLPLILLESIYVGKPIIITKVGFVEDVLGSNYELYCEPRNIESLVSAFTKFMDEKNENFGAKPMRLFYQKFSQKFHREILREIFLGD